MISTKSIQIHAADLRAQGLNFTIQFQGVSLMLTRRTGYKFPVVCVLTFLLFSAAHAQNQFSLGELQPGQLVLNLSATEQQDVAQDTLNASLMFSTQGRDK